MYFRDWMRSAQLPTWRKTAGNCMSYTYKVKVLLENEVYILVLYNFIISLYYKKYKRTATEEGCKYIAT
jgi:hypothetical protein